MKGVNQIIAKYTGREAKELTSDMTLTDMGVDSITRYEIATACEAVFELEDIPIEEIEKIESIQSIYDMVKKYTLVI
jgi:acyl carrier protein